MADIERKLIRDALELHGSVTKVAKLFGVNRTTIFRKLQGEDVEVQGNGQTARTAPPARG